MDVGLISQLKKLSYLDFILMIRMMPVYKETLFLLLEVFPTQDSLLKFLDLFAGQSIKLPPRPKLYHTIENINMYNYYKAHLDSERPLLTTARIYNVTTQRIQSVIERIESYGQEK